MSDKEMFEGLKDDIKPKLEEKFEDVTFKVVVGDYLDSYEILFSFFSDSAEEELAKEDKIRKFYYNVVKKSSTLQEFKDVFILFDILGEITEEEKLARKMKSILKKVNLSRLEISSQNNFKNEVIEKIKNVTDNKSKYETCAKVEEMRTSSILVA